MSKPLEQVRILIDARTAGQRLDLALAAILTWGVVHGWGTVYHFFFLFAAFLEKFHLLTQHVSSL